MTVNELATSLGITADIAPHVATAYERSKNDKFSFSLNDLERIQSDFSLFEEENYKVLKAGFIDFLKNEKLCKWATLVCEVLRQAKDQEALYQTPMPPVDDTEASAVFPLIPLLPFVEDAIKKYESIGFSHDDALMELRSLNVCMEGSRIILDKRGFASRYFGWCSIYIFATIFRYGVLNFQIIDFYDSIILLKNKKSAKIVTVMTDGVSHRSGHSLESAGLSDDAEGSYSADFSENETEYIGRVAKYGYAAKELTTFKKSEWEKIFEKGEKAVYVHIPRGVDLSVESVKQTVREGMKIVRERYGKNIKFAFCRSWLLSPNISQCLGAESKIISFGNTFDRYPIKSSGKELMSFLFGKVYDDYNELPEDTSLQRKVKQIYLNGGYIYSGAGIITDPQYYN